MARSSLSHDGSLRGDLQLDISAVGIMLGLSNILLAATAYLFSDQDPLILPTFPGY